MIPTLFLINFMLIIAINSSSRYSRLVYHYYLKKGQYSKAGFRLLSRAGFRTNTFLIAFFITALQWLMFLD